MKNFSMISFVIGRDRFDRRGHEGFRVEVISVVSLTCRVELLRTSELLEMIDPCETQQATSVYHSLEL